MENDNKLPFLDTVIHRRDNDVIFSVYRKPTNRDDFIHYLSAHNERTKRGVVIGFFLRAIRICSEEFLEEEFKYVIESFRKLRYPVGLLHNLKKKAKEIANREDDIDQNENVFVVVPFSSKAREIDSLLCKVGIRVAYKSGRKIGDIVKHRTNIVGDDNSAVYRIPCNGCSRSYYGETSRGLNKRIYEHKNDIKQHRSSNSLVVHIDEEGHLPQWQEAVVVHKGLQKKTRKIIEAAYITTEKVTNHRDGFIKLSRAAGKLIISNVTEVDPGG